jgi:FkbM family methyltransferase
MNDSALVEEHIKVKRCRNGLLMYNINDMYIGRSLDEYGEYSEGEDDVFRQILRPGMIALDIGANIGVHTVGMAKKVGRQGRVYAFEPQRALFQMLCGNVALNALGNVNAFMIALGNKSGQIDVPVVDYGHEGNFGGITLLQDTTEYLTEPVPLQMLDELKLPFCSFIKIDVEGMEQMVLEGAAATLERDQPILYIENNPGKSSAALLECLHGFGYRAYWHVVPLFNPKNYFGKTENVFANIASFNVLCFPKSSDVVLQGFDEVTPSNLTSPPAV